MVDDVGPLVALAVHSSAQPSYPTTAALSASRSPPTLAGFELLAAFAV